MANSVKYFLLVFCLPLLLAACAKNTRGPEPPEIRYGEDVCAQCNMIISDPRFAAGYVREIGVRHYESLAFDDIGGMLEHVQAQGEHTGNGSIVAWYVHDYYSETWIDATTAYFVVSSQIASPMAYGIAAHGTRSAADAMADGMAGEVLDWQSLQRREFLPHVHAH